MEKDYWENYYNSKKAPLQPSLFAEFVLEKYLKHGQKLIELGCGNGRDSIFFASHGVNVLAIDQCASEILQLSKENTNGNLEFKNSDFTKLNVNETFDIVYSRFTMHSIAKTEELKVLNWAFEHLNAGGKLLIEARGKNNELFRLGEPVQDDTDAYIYEDHYRRFIDLNVLKKELMECGFIILSAEEKSGFAPFNGTDQTFIRVVASKK